MKSICLSTLFFVVTTPVFADFTGASDHFQAAASSQNSDVGAIAPLSDQNVTLFGTTLQAIRTFYVNPVSDDTITENAARGMLSNLDPHSDYLDQEDFQDLKTMTDGQFSGLGIEITAANGAILVITPIDDSPAEKAGVKAGDYIVKINAVAVEGLSLTKAMNMMRGPKGQTVTLTVVRKDVDLPLDFKITRDNIKLKDVKTMMIDKHYAYIRIAMFEADTGAHAEQAILDLKKQNNGIYGVILDLRNNPGGVVQSSVSVANLFLNAATIGANKPVVYTKGRFADSQYTGYVTGTDLFHGLPIIVLINSGTASAAEIVSGALKDYHRAIIVGTTSFGKGSVQTVFPLPGDKTALKLTTALYYTPDGSSIQAKGITPDVLVHSYSIPDTVKANDIHTIREADLNDHLENGDTHPDDQSIADTVDTQDGDVQNIQQIANGKTSSDDLTQSQNLFYKDYQLYTAVNLLMALHVEMQSS
ncbi:MAG: S41 family peptidase [Gammaproteobacteria bacterium]|nr:S41 family peptidase [Gammaproteobacteria bacterium]